MLQTTFTYNKDSNYSKLNCDQLVKDTNMIQTVKTNSNIDVYLPKHETGIKRFEL